MDSVTNCTVCHSCLTLHVGVSFKQTFMSITSVHGVELVLQHG